MTKHLSVKDANEAQRKRRPATKMMRDSISVRILNPKEAGLGGEDGIKRSTTIKEMKREAKRNRDSQLAGK